MPRTIHRIAASGAALLFGVAALTACGANDAESGGDSGDGGGDSKVIALLLPESKTTRYEAFDKPLFEDAVADALRRLRGRLLQRRPGRGQADPAGRHGHLRGCQRRRPRPGQRCGCRRHGPVRAGLGRQGHRLRPVHRRGRLLHVLRQRDRRPDAGRGPRRGDGRQGRHPDAQRRPQRPQRRAVQGRRAQRPRRERRRDPRGVRQPRLEPGERADVRQRPAQQVRRLGDQRRLRRQRRPGRRRGRSPHRWRGRRGRPPADHRPGRRDLRASSGSSPASRP